MSVTLQAWKTKNPWLAEDKSMLMEANQSLPVRKEVSFYKQLRAHQVTLYVRSNSFSYTDNIFSIINTYKIGVTYLI